MSKFKIGDKVRIKENLNEYDFYDVIPEMLKYRGKEFEIADLRYNTIFGEFYMLNNVDYFWHEDALELVNESEIKILGVDYTTNTLKIEESVSQKVRGFEIVSDEFRKYIDVNIKIPRRSSSKSAGYDIYTPIDITIPPNGISDAVQTDIKAYMLDDEYLEIVPRSSLGFKKGLMLINTCGIIDSDYYSNPDNDGNIGFKFKNLTDKTVELKAGERILQGIFKKYLITDYDNCDIERMGGIGSTGNK